MSQDLVIWAGPVAKFQVPLATVPNAVEKFFQCTGDGNPSCSGVVASYGDDEGRRLPNVVNAAKSSLEATPEVFLGAFSAGGGFVRGLVQSPADRPFVRAMCLADATYSSWLNQKDEIPLINDFWLQWGDYLIQKSQGKQLWVATSSEGANFDLPNGIETQREIRRQLELRNGIKFEQLDNNFFGINPKPKAVYQYGSIIFAEFPDVSHGDHANVLANQVWQNITNPWLTALRSGNPWVTPGEQPGPGPGPKPEPTNPVEPEPWTKDPLPWLLFGTGAVVSFYSVYWWYKNSRRG